MGAAPQPTAVLRSAGPGRGSPRSDARAPPEGPGEAGEKRRESGRWEGNDEGGGQNKTQTGEQSTDVGKRQGAIQRELGGRRDPSRFFSSRRGKCSKKPPSPAGPRPAHFSPNGMPAPEPRRAPAFLPFPPAPLGLWLSLARSSLPPLLPLSPAPPSARPLPPSQLPRRGSRARAPLLRPGLGARAPGRPAARGAGARRSSHPLRRRRRERGPRGELGPLPCLGLTCHPSRSGLRCKPPPPPPRPTPRAPHPTPLGQASPSNPRGSCPAHSATGSGRAGRESVGWRRARSPGRPSPPGAGGGALGKAHPGGLGLGKRLRPRRADASLAREPKPGVSPKAPGRKRSPPPLERQPRSSPSHAHSCDPHAELENFPRLPAARSPLAHSSPQPLETLPPCLPSPARAEGCCAQAPSLRPPRPTNLPEPRRGGQARTGTPPLPAEAPRDRPGQDSAPGSLPALGGWLAGL